MRKKKVFPETKFKPEILREASLSLYKLVKKDKPISPSLNLRLKNYDGVSWVHDSEDEFFSDYRKDHDSSTYEIRYPDGYWIEVDYYGWKPDTEVAVWAPSRHEIESIFEIFESNADNCKVTPKPKIEYKINPTIFIGHGGSLQWKELKDHLHDKHGYDIEAYEVGSRAGHAIRDILEDMLSKSSFAILVMTGEDRDEKGNLKPRQNVIHELGLFQGRLGFSKVIVLLEEGTEEFSNIHGIHQIRYGKGNIKETFGEVLATLRREFGT